MTLISCSLERLPIFALINTYLSIVNFSSLIHYQPFLFLIFLFLTLIILPSNNSANMHKKYFSHPLVFYSIILFELFTPFIRSCVLISNCVDAYPFFKSLHQFFIPSISLCCSLILYPFPPPVPSPSRCFHANAFHPLIFYAWFAPPPPRCAATHISFPRSFPLAHHTLSPSIYVARKTFQHYQNFLTAHKRRYLPTPALNGYCLADY